MRNNRRTKRLKPGEIIPMTFDYVFTSIFNKEENIVILENFLSCYFELPIEKLRGKIKIFPRELELKGKKEANKQVDLVVDIEGEKINVELSNKIDDGIINRNIVFACNIHSRSLKHGSNHYNDISHTIQINLSNYHINEKLKETYYLRNEEGKILSQKFRIDFVDMVIGRKLCYTDGENKLARWCKVFTAESEEEFKKAMGDGLMEEEAKTKLKDEVNKYSCDDEVIALYSAYTKQELEFNTFMDDARKDGIKRGLKQGLNQGKQEKQEEIARNMLKKNYDIFDIVEITGLTKEQIESL